MTASTRPFLMTAFVALAAALVIVAVSPILSVAAHIVA